MKEKVSENFERKIEQGWKNVALYIFAKWSEFKLVKDWKETVISLSDDSVIGETTLLQYLDLKETKATASVEIKWKYYEISFKEFKNKFDNLPDKDKEALISFLKELENKRKWKTKVVEK